MAGGLNGLMRGIQLHKLEAVAKRVALADQGVDFYRTEGEGEVQLHDLAQWNFNRQHGGESGFADIRGMAFQPAARLGRDADIDLDFEARMTPGVGSVSIAAG